MEGYLQNATLDCSDTRHWVMKMWKSAIRVRRKMVLSWRSGCFECRRKSAEKQDPEPAIQQTGRPLSDSESGVGRCPTPTVPYKSSGNDDGPPSFTTATLTPGEWAELWW